MSRHSLSKLTEHGHLRATKKELDTSFRSIAIAARSSSVCLLQSVSSAAAFTNMELRNAEEQVERMVVEYKSLCSSEKRLFDISALEGDAANDVTEEAVATKRNAEDVLSTLESLQQTLETLKPKIDRFRKRLGEVRIEGYRYLLWE